MSEPAARAVHRICSACDVEINDDRPDRTCPTCGAKLIEVSGGSNDDLIGTVIDGRFEIRSLLGQGGMGSVYRAWQRSVGREVAVKLIDRAFARDAMAVRRFLREARLASQLSQPNTVSVFDFGQAEDGRLFIAMELIKGRTLHEVLKTDGPFPVPRVIRVGMQICDALDAAHALNIMHRDMKLENLIVLDHPPGRDLVKVLDFGLAKTLGDDQSRGTQSGVVVGTPRYMAPEAAMSGIALPAGDLYALGVILAELTIGRALWNEVSLPALVAQKLDPSPVIAQLPVALREVIGRLLEPEPDARPTAAHARALLAAIGETPSAPALPFARPATLDLDPIGPTVPSPRATPAVNPIAYAATSASVGALRVSVSTPVPKVAPPGTGVTLMPSTASHETVEARRRWGLIGGVVGAAAAVVVVAVVLATRGGGGRAHDRAAPTPPTPPLVSPAADHVAAGSAVTVERVAIDAGAPAPASITLHVRSKPAGATITRDQISLGVAPIDVVIPQATTAIVITARIANRTGSQRVVPDQNRDVEIVVPAPRAHAGAGTTTTAPPPHAGSDDQVPF